MNKMFLIYPRDSCVQQNDNAQRIYPDLSILKHPQYTQGYQRNLDTKNIGSFAT